MKVVHWHYTSHPLYRDTKWSHFIYFPSYYFSVSKQKNFFSEPTDTPCYRERRRRHVGLQPL